MNAPIVSFNHVGKSFDVDGFELEAIREFNLEVAEGEFVAIVGASGCGKSTLLRLLVGLDTQFRGEIRVDGNAVSGIGGERGIVFQEHRLFPWLTVAQNIGLGLVNEPLNEAERTRRINDFIELVGLTDFTRAYPHQLSGGMAQRVAIARGLVASPRILLLDEPFGALDALTRQQMQDELLAIRARARITTVLVTHDQEEALSLSDRIGILGSGRLQQVGTPLELYRKPANRFVAEFIGQANLIKAQPTSVAGVFEAVDRFENEGQGLLLGTELDVTATQPLRFVLRPERIRVVPATPPEPRPAGRPVIRSPNRTGGTLRELSYSGGSIRLVVDLFGGGQLIAQAEDAQFTELPVVGQPLALTWRIEDVVPLPAEEEVPA